MLLGLCRVGDRFSAEGGRRWLGWATWFEHALERTHQVRAGRDASFAATACGNSLQCVWVRIAIGITLVCAWNHPGTHLGLACFRPNLLYSKVHDGGIDRLPPAAPASARLEGLRCRISIGPQARTMPRGTPHRGTLPAIVHRTGAHAPCAVDIQRMTRRGFSKAGARRG